MTRASANPEMSLGAHKVLNALWNSDHAPFKGDLSSVCWDFI